MTVAKRESVYIGVGSLPAVAVPLTCLAVIPRAWVYMIPAFFVLTLLAGLAIIFIKDGPHVAAAAKYAVFGGLVYYALLCVYVGIRQDGPVSLPGLLLLGIFVVPAIFIQSIAIAKIFTAKSTPSNP